MTSFGGSLLIKPNPIDFDKVLVEFGRLDETGNVAVIVTVAVALAIYLVVAVILRRTDRDEAGRRVSYKDFTLFIANSVCFSSFYRFESEM